MQKNIFYNGLLEIAGKIHQQEVSSYEVTLNLLERIENLDIKLLSYVTVLKQQALEAARQADIEIAEGNIRSPIHGVPIALKDLFDMASIPTTNGMTIAPNIPMYNATVVNKLLDAGAIILGKLKLTEAAFSDPHPDIPVPLNPWGSQLWAGSSSNGSAVALASGLCFGSLGTDTGGSIRFPCAANNLTGIKPTWGRVSRSGVFEFAGSLDHVGPMARSVEDVAVLLEIIAGYDLNDPTTSNEVVPNYLQEMVKGIKGLKIGVDHEFIFNKIDLDTKLVMEHVIETIRFLGAEIVEINMPDTKQAAANWAPLCAVETAVVHEKNYKKFKNNYGPSFSKFIEMGQGIIATEYFKLVQFRNELKYTISSVFDEVDLLLMPVSAYSALPTDLSEKFSEDKELFEGTVRFTSAFNLTGHPTLTLPGGFTRKGTPIGFQFVASYFQEELLVRAGSDFQKATSWHKAQPAISNLGYSAS
ncbi:amidase [Acinetobacter baumannii]